MLSLWLLAQCSSDELALSLVLRVMEVSNLGALLQSRQADLGVI